MATTKYITYLTFQGKKYDVEVTKIAINLWIAVVNVNYEGYANPIEVTQNGKSQLDAIGKLRKFLSD